jgi:pimeloyl-ACP methyl ester carboxylesterase
MLKSGELEYETSGDGETVLFIHGAHIADSYLPLMAEPALAQHHLIRYHRRGFAGSKPHAGPFSIPDQARDALRLLERLGTTQAHLVGHSYGGCIALEMAFQAPDVVRSLVLMEPALLMVPSAAAMQTEVVRIAERYAAADPAGAVDDFLTVIGGTDWRSRVSTLVPGAPKQAERDAATFFEVELPAIGEWHFTALLAGQLSQPVLTVTGTDTLPFLAEGRTLLHNWIERAEDLEVRGANHLLQLHSRHSATRIAEGIAEFLKRHSCP